LGPKPQTSEGRALLNLNQSALAGQRPCTECIRDRTRAAMLPVETGSALVLRAAAR